jgi:hypothetical protein
MRTLQPSDATHKSRKRLVVGSRQEGERAENHASRRSWAPSPPEKRRDTRPTNAGQTFLGRVSRRQGRAGALRVALGVGLVFGATACGLFESAGEVTLGAGQLPRVQESVQWPDIDEMTGSSLAGSVDATKDGEPLITGLPTSLKKGTLAHVQGILALAGDCRRTFTQESLGDGSEAVTNLTIRVTNCTGDDRCKYLCGDFEGMQIEASVDLQLLDAEKAESLASQLKQASPEAAVQAIVQLRLRFFELMLFQSDSAGEQEDVTHRLERFEMIIAQVGAELPDNLEGAASGEFIADPSGATESDGSPKLVPYSGPHWVKVLEGDFIERIVPEKPQRFEIDPNVPFTLALKDTFVAGEPSSMRLVNRLRITRPDLYELRFDGAGINFDVQPEVVLSVLQLLKNL